MESEIYYDSDDGYLPAELIELLSQPRFPVGPDLARVLLHWHGYRPVTAAGPIWNRKFHFLNWAVRGRATEVIAYLNASANAADHKVAETITKIASWHIPSATLPAAITTGMYGWLVKELHPDYRWPYGFGEALPLKGSEEDE